MTELIIILRVIAGFGGALFVYGAFFLYENEEKRLQNRLESWWIALDYGKQDFRGRLLTLVSGIARTALAALRAGFGKEVVSYRFAIVAFLLSYFSYGLYKWVYVLFGTEDHSGARLEYCLSIPYIIERTCVRQSSYAMSLGMLGSIMISALLFIAIILCARYVRDTQISRTRFALLTFALCCIPAVSASTFSYIMGHPRDHFRIVSGPLLMTLAVGSDILSIWVTRHAIVRVEDAKTLLESFKWMSLDGAVVLSLVLIPLLLVPVMPGGDWSKGTLAIAGANLTTSLPSLLWLAIGTGLILNWFLWPTILRGLYSLARARVFQHRKKMAAIGFSMLGVAIPGVLSIPGAVWKTIHSNLTP